MEDVCLQRVMCEAFAKFDGADGTIELGELMQIFESIGNAISGASSDPRSQFARSFLTVTYLLHRGRGFGNYGKIRQTRRRQN